MSIPTHHGFGGQNVGMDLEKKLYKHFVNETRARENIGLCHWYSEPGTWESGFLPSLRPWLGGPTGHHQWSA
jgi:hypothetical protein